MSRKHDILKAVIEIFISTANPVGSKYLKESSGFDVSPATLRNEMARLEKEGFLQQSHSSGGRVPTSEGYRFFVNDLNISSPQKKEFQKEFQTITKKYFQEKQADQLVYDAISILSKMTPNIAFATIPSAKKTFFLGVSHLLSQPEFSMAPQDFSGVFRVLEEDLYQFLYSLDIRNEVELFIGNENLLSGIDSCSLLVSSIEILNEPVFFGILGPMRMNYEKNIVAVEETKKLLEMMV